METDPTAQAESSSGTVPGPSTLEASSPEAPAANGGFWSRAWAGLVSPRLVWPWLREKLCGLGQARDVEVAAEDGVLPERQEEDDVPQDVQPPMPPEEEAMVTGAALPAPVQGRERSPERLQRPRKRRAPSPEPAPRPKKRRARRRRRTNRRRLRKMKQRQ